VVAVPVVVGPVVVRLVALVHKLQSEDRPQVEMVKLMKYLTRKIITKNLTLRNKLYQ
jgi:hypothetical protein